MEGKADKAGADESNKSGVKQPDGNQHLNQSQASIYRYLTSPRIHSLLTSRSLQQAGRLPSIYNSIKGKEPLLCESFQSLNHEQDINVNDRRSFRTSTASVFHAEHMFPPPSMETPNHGSTITSGHSIGNLNNSVEASNDYLLPPETQQGDWISGSSLSNTNWINWQSSSQITKPKAATAWGPQGFRYQAVLNQILASNNSHLNDDTPLQLQPAKMPIQQGAGSSTKGESSPIQFDGIVPTNPDMRKMTRQDSSPPTPKLPFINWMLPGQDNQGLNNPSNQDQSSHGNQDQNNIGNQGQNTPSNQGKNNSIPLAFGSRSQEIFGTSRGASPIALSPLSSRSLQQAGTSPSIYKSIKGKEPFLCESFQSFNHEQDINVNDQQPFRTSTGSVFHAEHMFSPPSMETPDHGSKLTSGHSTGNLKNFLEASNDYHLPISNLPPKFRLGSSSGLQVPETQKGNWTSGSSLANTDWINWQPSSQITKPEPATALGSQGFEFQASLNQVMASNNSHLSDDPPRQLQPTKAPIQQGFGSSIKEASSPIQFDDNVPSNSNKRKVTWHDSTPPTPKVPFINWMLPGQDNQKVPFINWMLPAQDNQGQNSLGNQGQNTPDNRGDNSSVSNNTPPPPKLPFINWMLPGQGKQGENIPGNQGQNILDIQGKNNSVSNSTPPPSKLPFINWMLPGQGNQGENNRGNQGQNTPDNQGKNNSVSNSTPTPPKLPFINWMLPGQSNQGQNTSDNQGTNNSVSNSTPPPPKLPFINWMLPGQGNQGENHPGDQGQKTLDNQGTNNSVSDSTPPAPKLPFINWMLPGQGNQGENHPGDQGQKTLDNQGTNNSVSDSTPPPPKLPFINWMLPGHSNQGENGLGNQGQETPDSQGKNSSVSNSTPPSPKLPFINWMLPGQGNQGQNSPDNQG
ncbi:Uncharacterized protein TCM_025320 [Theobroma cacao]|uniref:Uncharacterized protein n=1 Tax=Theobroma cacao TaxID=3641 RepID=A0A061EYR4_THECC|nr:Uncharacterized protein TCM_025320 [Theobroma cacao]